jgi:hypothetical protein
MEIKGLVAGSGPKVAQAQHGALIWRFLTERSRTRACVSTPRPASVHLTLRNTYLLLLLGVHPCVCRGDTVLGHAPQSQQGSSLRVQGRRMSKAIIGIHVVEGSLECLTNNQPDNEISEGWSNGGDGERVEPGRKAPPDDRAKDSHARGYTRVTQSKPHPFTFAGRHVGIGAAAGRFLAITFLGMTRCHPRVVSSPGPSPDPGRRVGALTRSAPCLICAVG